MAFIDCWSQHAEKAGLGEVDKELIYKRAKDLERFNQVPMVDALRQAAREHVEPKITSHHEQVRNIFRQAKVELPSSKPPPKPEESLDTEEDPPVTEPPKNDSGVYDPEETQAEVIAYEPKSKKDRESAKIRVLQTGPDKWISAIDYQTPIEGRSGPLSEHSEVFPTRDAALEAAAQELTMHFQRGLERTDSMSNATEKKRLRNLKAWADDILERQKGKAHLDELIDNSRGLPTPGDFVKIKMPDGTEHTGEVMDSGGQRWIKVEGKDPILAHEIESFEVVEPPKNKKSEINERKYGKDQYPEPKTRQEIEDTLWNLAADHNELFRKGSRMHGGGPNAPYDPENTRRTFQLEAQFHRLADRIGLAKTKRNYILNQALVRRAGKPLERAPAIAHRTTEQSDYVAPKPSDFDPDPISRAKRSPRPALDYLTKKELESSLADAKAKLAKGRMRPERRQKFQRIVEERTKQLAMGDYHEAVLEREKKQVDTAITKVEKKIDSVGNRSAKSIKEEIIARVQAVLDQLSEESGIRINDQGDDRVFFEKEENNHAVGWADISEKEGKVTADYYRPHDSGGPGEPIPERDFRELKGKVVADSRAEALAKVKAILSSAPGRVTFHIPGDGTFDLERSGHALSELLRRADAMKTGEDVDKKASKGAGGEVDFYAQQLHETMGKTEALADQRAQLKLVKSKAAIALIQKTIKALERWPDDEKPKALPAPEPEPPKSDEPPPGPYYITESVDNGKRTYGVEQGRSYADKFIGQAPENPYGEYGMTKAQANKRLAELNAPRETEAEGVQGATIAPEAPITSAAEAGVPPEVDPKGGVSVGAPPLKPLPPTSVKTPKSQRQIITDLARALNVPFRFGRLRHRFSGYFLPTQNLIASKHPDHIPIAMHEFGHKFDREFKMSSDKSIAAELNVLGDPGTQGSMSSWTKSKSKKYKMGEGVAEFIRYWLTDPQHAENAAPNTHKLFESLLDANKDLGDKFRQAQDDIETLRSADPQMRIRSQISVGENPNKTPYTLSQLTRDLVDDLHFVRLPFMELKERLAEKGQALSTLKDAYLLARNLRGSYGMAATFIRDGVVDFTSRKVTLGTSMQDALKPVGGRINDFRDWIVAKRAAELMRQGKETGLRADDVARTVKRFDQDADFQRAFADLKIWRTHLVKYAVDSGLISPKSAVAMLQLHQDYVPMHRIFEVGAGEPPSAEGGGGRGLNVGKPGSFKHLSGSRRQIVDPIETMVKDAYTIITASEKTAINHAVAELANKPDMGKWVERIADPKEQVKVGLEKIRKQLEDAGANLEDVDDDLALMFYRNGKQAPFGENTIRISRNGKNEFYRLDKDLFATFNALDLEDSARIIRYAAVPGNLLRSGVVLEPSFALANIMRDAFSSAVISRHGALPFEAIFRGFKSMLSNPELVARWRASGGSNAIELNYFDRQKLQGFMRDRITKDLTPFERALVITKSPLTALRALSSLSEESTRIGEFEIAYKKYLKGGMSEGEASRLAAFESRDRQDFAKGGAITKIPRALTPFWNAGLQANVALAQAFKTRPMRTFLQGFVFVTLPKMAEQALNWEDKDYWDRPQWERDLFFMLPAGKDSTGHTRFVRIPTPFEVGLLFGTFPGRIMQGLHDGASEAMTGFPSFFLRQSIPNPIPQGLQVLVEDYLTGKQGWDIYRGRPIVPDSLADQAPELQWTDQTSTLARKVGETFGISPMKIDHMISQTTGGMGKLLTGAQAPGKRFVSTPLRASSQTMEDFYARLASLQTEESRVKAGTSTADVSALRYFRAAARQMGELRTASRLATDQATKEQLQEQIYQKAKETLEAIPASP